MTEKRRDRNIRLLTFFILLLTGVNGGLYAQEEAEAPTRLARIYEDNDFMNIRGQGTDDAYTNGTRAELFYTKKKPSRFFLDRLLPKAGDSSVNVFGWGAMELMYTPNNLNDPAYQPNDYPWSAALAATHTLYSYNPAEKYDFQTELVAGVMGPAALGEQTQKFIHRVLQFQQPMGWSHQYRNALLLNINFTAEKQLFARGPVEVIGGAQVCAGTMQNSVAVYPLIRIGRFAPYFNGFFSQYTGSVKAAGSGRRKKIQAYLVIRPETQLVFTNALLQGGIFTKNPNIAKPGTSTQAEISAGSETPYHAISPVIYSISYGAVVASGHFGLSFVQNTASAAMKTLYYHEVENVSLYYAW